MMEKAELIVRTISPTLKYTGRKELTLAIKHMAQLGATGGFDDILVTKDVYPAVAKEIGAKQHTAEKSIYRAVNICWRDGENPGLNGIIGKKLPYKPQPSLFIMYCAYYHIYGVAYHEAAERKLPLLF